MLSAAQKESLLEAAKIASAPERTSIIPIPYTLAVWALESGWGQKLAGKNNCFGIKEYPGCYGTELVHTHEWFTELELKRFLARGHGRTATVAPSQPRADHRKYYAVQDWFATFPTLEACFDKRLSLIMKGDTYRQAFQHFRESANLEQFVREVSRHYSTADSERYTRDVLSIANSDSVKQAIAAAVSAA